MEKEEYVKRAQKLGHNAKMIDKTLKEAERFEKKFGVPYDFSMDLVELPISDPDPTMESKQR